MRLWWWRKVRRANIPHEERDLFERHGELRLQLLLAGAAGATTPQELLDIYKSQDETKINHIVDWLREQADVREQREQRLETAEWAIIILIVLELGIAIYGAHEGGEQTAVLDQLQKSTSATAQTLTSLAETMKDMQKTEHNLLVLNYDASLTVGINPNPPTLTLQNTGKTDVSFWGYRVWDQKPFFTNAGVVINPAIPYTLPADAIYKTLSQRLPKAQKLDVPFEVYLRNGLGEDYIAKVSFSAESYSANTFVTSSRMLSITAERWSDKTAK